MSDAQRHGFLAPELGARADPDGEPLGVDLRDLRFDREVRQLAWRLWRDYQKSVRVQPQALVDAGLSPVELWQPGITESLETCSTEDELRRYRQKLRFRADFLEIMLEETLTEMEKADRARPTGNATPAA